MIEENRRSKFAYSVLIFIPFMASMAQTAIAFGLALVACLYAWSFKNPTIYSLNLVIKIAAIGVAGQLCGAHGFLSNDLYSSLKDSWYFINAVLYVILGVIAFGVGEWRNKFL